MAVEFEFQMHKIVFFNIKLNFALSSFAFFEAFFKLTRGGNKRISLGFVSKIRFFLSFFAKRVEKK